MKAMTQLTREGLLLAVYNKLNTVGGDGCGTSAGEHKPLGSAASVADAIKAHSLEQVLIPGTRPPLTFAAGYHAVYGSKLERK